MRHPENVCGGGEAELGLVMLTYTVISFFRRLLKKNCCDLMLFLFVLGFMHVYLFTGIIEPDNSDDCVEPTRECRRICNEEALQLSLSSGRYPKYLGIEGPQDRNNAQT